MKLHLESRTALNTFTGYGEGYVMVNGERIERSVVVLPDRILTDWPAGRFDELVPEHFAALADLGREIVLLGTGNRLRFPRPEIIRPLIGAGIGVEVMDLQAACRTYNILMAEERKVAAALLFA
ncbi:MAG TPA: Mth938-like domain-containing protein [Burkholderiales bacterium]|nr:Mth938-like domain-containing protein [Burkholderiales bacterium]